MDFSSILKEIKPTESEQLEISKMSGSILDYLTYECKNRNIDAEIFLVGSVAKGTYLKGKSDIDIFIASHQILNHLISHFQFVVRS